MRNSVIKIAVVALGLTAACGAGGADLCGPPECSAAVAEGCDDGDCPDAPDAPGDGDGGSDEAPGDPADPDAGVPDDPDAECPAYHRTAHDGRCEPDRDRVNEVCRDAWLTRANGRGDPFPMLDARQSWFFVEVLDGIDVELFPADWESFRTRWPHTEATDDVFASCEVPVAWFAVPRSIAPTFDPVLADVRSGVLGSGDEATTRAVDHDAVGGLVLSWNRRFFKRVEASLQWFMQPGASPTDLVSRLRAARGVPAQQSIVEAPITAFVERPSAPIMAWRAFAATDDPGSAPWIAPRPEFPTLRAMPVEPAPTEIDVASSLSVADVWPVFKSAVWMTAGGGVSECRTGTNAIANVVADEHLVDAVRRARQQQVAICVDLVWSPGRGWDLLHTESCIQVTGELGPTTTRAVTAGERLELGLPASLDALLCP